MKVPINNLENIALSITRAVGSVWSLIIHTILFMSAFSLVFFGFKFELVLLGLTTVLSLEAIYLSIFIQLSVNHQALALANVEKDIEEIAEDVEEIAEDVEEMQENIDEIQEGVDEITDEHEKNIER